MNRHLYRLAIFLITLSISSTTRAGGPPFTPRVEALSELGLVVNFDEEFSAATAPAESGLGNSRGGNLASADFTELQVFAFQFEGPDSIRNFARARAEDTLTITPAGSPVGSTNLQMIWHLEGTNVGDGLLTQLSSQYRTDASGFPATSAGAINVGSIPAVDQIVTFNMVDVPLGSPFNYRTSLVADISSTGAAEIDFDNSATFLGHRLFVGGVLTDATVVGGSGQVYTAIPEPSTVVAALLAAGGLLARRRF